MLRTLLLLIMNLIFPPHCIFCRRVLGLSAKGHLCLDCMKQLSFCFSFRQCARCGRPVSEEDKYCSRCAQGHRPSYQRVFAPYLYEGKARASILWFKKERYRDYGRTYAEHMIIAMQESGVLEEVEVVVSAPPRKGKLYQGGYDQARALAGALAKRIQKPRLLWVLRQKEKRPKQSYLDLEDRWGNVMGNIRVARPKAVAGKRVLLVDDVCTTGATLNECARVLKEAGAEEVFCAVAAIAPDENF